MTSPSGRNKSGFYRIRKNGKYEAPSVSTVLALLGKDALSWGAAKETALFAVHCQDEWINKSSEEAYHLLRLRHRKIWDEKSEVGTIVHDVALSWSKNQEVDVADLVIQKKWVNGFESPFERVNGCLDALEKFYNDHSPEWIHVEQTVIYTGTNSAYEIDGDQCYGGSFDGICRLKNGLTYRIDWKTGQRYPINTMLQLAAYEFAPFIGIYSSGHPEEIIDNPRTDRQAVIYLHDDGTYELLELPVDESTHQRFMELRAIKAWMDNMEKWVKENPESERVSV